MQPFIHIAEARGPLDDQLQRDAEALQAAVSDLVRIYQFRDRDKICCYDVSVTQCHALEALVVKGPLRANNLSNLMLLDKSTTSRLLDTLERKGYIARSPDPEDGRASVVGVTPAGEALYRQINADLVEQQRDIVASLDPAVREGVILVIKQLARAAEARFVSGVSCGPSGCNPC